MYKSILSLVFLLLSSTLMAQAGIKPRKKPKLKLPMVALGLYGSGGFTNNSELAGTIQSINSAGRETGNLATASKMANLYGGGGLQIRHFFSWLDFGWLGLQASGDFHFFENANYGANIAGDPKVEALANLQSHTMITIGIAALATIFRNKYSAIHFGVGGLFSIEQFTYSVQAQPGVFNTSNDFKFKGSGLGFNIFFGGEIKIAKNVNLFSELHGRILNISELKATNDGNEYYMQKGQLAGTKELEILDAQISSDPTKISWSQFGFQIKVGTYFYLN